jgi:hypothetical protein
MELFAITPADPLPAVSRTRCAPELIRPSLCVQAREGRLHVFLPYAPSLRTISTWSRGRGYMPVSENAGLGGGLRSGSRSAAAIVQRHSRPRRSGSKPAAREQLGRTGTDQHLLDEEARRNRLTAEKFATTAAISLPAAAATS